MPATGKMGKLDRKAKAQGVLGVVGNAYVQAKEKYKDLTKPLERTKRESNNLNQDKMLRELERRAL